MDFTAQDAAALIGIEVFPDGWQFVPVVRGGVIAGFFCHKKNEIHAYRVPNHSGKWLMRQDIEKVSGPLLREYGHIITTVRIGNEDGMRFVTRLGFIETHRAEGLVYFRTEKLHHARH